MILCLLAGFTLAYGQQEPDAIQCPYTEAVRTQVDPEGRHTETHIQVVAAEFNVAMPDSEFTWQKISPPDHALIADYRPSGRHGIWDAKAKSVLFSRSAAP